eukprot:COSAG06_NODE_65407_length_257_cov_0.645570_1_plen_21_part_10
MILPDGSRAQPVSAVVIRITL